MSHAVLRWRELREQVRPFGVTTHPGDAPVGGIGWRVRRPSASSLATTRVMVGGATCSWSASAPRVSGPWRSTAARAESWLGERPVGLLAQPAGQAGGAQAQAAGDLEVVHER